MPRPSAARLLAICLLLCSLTACTTTGNGAAAGPASGKDGAAASKIAVGVAYSRGGRGDKSFNDSVGAGVDRAKAELGVPVKELSPNAAGSDLEEVLRLLAETGHNPVLAVGFFYAQPLTKVAPAFPRTQFVIIDDATVKLPNVTNVAFREEEASYLVGAAAALKSATGRIGFIGGVQTPPQESFLAGYAAGARKINPKIHLSSVFITQPPDFSGFSSPDKAQEAARGMYDSGADIVYHAAGASGLGVFQAAKAAGKWAIGVDVDQRKTVDPELADVILTSATKELDVAVLRVIQEAAAGKAVYGLREFGLKEEGVAYATSGGGISDIAPRLEEIRKQIISGRITVPAVP
ncbi:basic membrane protein A [Streptosporangium becharense]|uniref:Basic membrane protein A n=1 Tax=Streptosporangium becharense TaxID=1816182 RepID=A0A7W9ILZ3_9ACTN|nr:BMP family ABC transporter substrate-binding protein [Streptosporangium becharense]MBB2911693.1 basic membrane protein A [Streptosporangium becharense]MBB5822489.1 basic membrane protein A [Streptosporangium becharense]